MNSNWTRRRCVQTVLAGGAGLSLALFASAEEVTTAQGEKAKVQERSIELFNTHTNETVSAVYKARDRIGKSLREQLKEMEREHG